jgi:hypothetical protein
MSNGEAVQTIANFIDLVETKYKEEFEIEIKKAKEAINLINEVLY